MILVFFPNQFAGVVKLCLPNGFLSECLRKTSVWNIYSIGSSWFESICCSSFLDKPCLSMVIIDDQISAWSKIKTQPNETNQTSIKKHRKRLVTESNHQRSTLGTTICNRKRWKNQALNHSAGPALPALPALQCLVGEFQARTAHLAETATCGRPGGHGSRAFTSKRAVVLTLGRNTKTQFSRLGTIAFQILQAKYVCQNVYIITLYKPV